MKMSPDDFFAWLAPVAVPICKKYGIYPSVCLAQGAIESAWGDAIIGSYNLFGRKAVDGDDAMNCNTQEEVDGQMVDTDADFKLYPSLEAAIEDYCILVTEDSKYSCAYIFAGKDRNAYIDNLARIYATRDDYNVEIKETIEANDLDRFDA